MAAVKTGIMIASAAALGLGAVFLKTAGDMEQTEIAFTTILGSAEKAKALLGDIAKFAAATPFEQTELIGYAKSMLGVGFAASDIIPTMETLGNIAAGIGKEKLPNIVLAFNKMKAKGRASLEELWPIVEAGVPILDQLAKDMGVKNKDAVIALATAGKLSFEQVNKSMKEVEKNNFAGLMIKQSKSFLGVISNVVDVLTMFAVQTGKEMLPKAKELALAFLEWFDANKAWLSLNIAKAFEGLFDAVSNVFTALSALVGLFGEASSDGDTVKYVVEGLTYASFIYLAVLGAMKLATIGATIATIAYSIPLWAAQAAIWAITAAEIAGAAATWLMTAATWAFGIAMAVATWPITLIILAIAALIAIGVLLYNNWDKIGEFFSGLWTGIKDSFASAIDWIVAKFTAVTDWIGKKWQGVKDFFGLGGDVSINAGQPEGAASGGGMEVPAMATGTNFVPENMFAQLHKGEAVVPAKYNNGQAGGTVNDIKVNVQVAVPAGTNESQATYIRKVAKDAIEQTWQGILRQTTVTNMVTE